jgi:hypothetical protein
MRFEMGTDFIKSMRRSGWVNIFHRLNQGKEYPPLPETKRIELAAFFQSDVEGLSELLDRDLTHWLQAEERPPSISDSTEVVAT